jgi:hypothetical protein
MSQGAELNLDQQISYVESILQYDKQRNVILNPFVGCSTESLLVSIRNSLVELKALKNV